METNKIYLGDSYQLMKDIPNQSVDCVYTDVPYLYTQSGNGEGRGSELNKSIRNKNRQLSDANIVDGFDYNLLGEMVRVCKKINIFIWCSRLQILDILKYFENLDCTYDILVWNKTNPIPATNNVWLSDIEYCLYFRGKGVKLNDGYEIKSKWFTTPINQNDKNEFSHPTIKPLELVKRHLLHATQPDDIVLDPFMGSGTTCVASQEIGRKYIGMEIDSTYFRISKDRLNGINVSGQTSIFTDFDNL